MRIAFAAARSALACSHRTYGGAGQLLRWKQHLRWPLLAACSSRAYASWLEALGNSDLETVLRRQPGLELKPLRPYVSLAWNLPRRAKVIAESCDFIASAPERIRRCVESRNGVLLARIGAGHDRLGSVVAGWVPRFR